MCDYLQNTILPTCIHNKCNTEDGESKHTISCLKDYKELVTNAVSTFTYEDSISSIKFFIRNFPMNVCRYSGYHHKLSPGGGRPPPCKCEKQMKWELEQVNEAISSIPTTEYLYTDDFGKYNKGECAEKIEFVGLCGCLGLVHISDNGKVFAWHIAGIDLSFHIGERKSMMRMMFSGLELEAADERLNTWKKLVKANTGTTFISGPNADEEARIFFGVEKEHCWRIQDSNVGMDGVNVIFDRKINNWCK